MSNNHSSSHQHMSQKTGKQKVKTFISKSDV